jgi:hypothetical protein
MMKWRALRQFHHEFVDGLDVCVFRFQEIVRALERLTRSRTIDIMYRIYWYRTSIRSTPSIEIDPDNIQLAQEVKELLDQTIDEGLAGEASSHNALMKTKNAIIKPVPEPLYLFQDPGSPLEIFMPNKPRAWLALLYTSRRVSYEARSVLYGANRFSLEEVEIANTWILTGASK